MVEFSGVSIGSRQQKNLKNRLWNKIRKKQKDFENKSGQKNLENK